MSSTGGPIKRMNLFTAVNDAMRIALETDESAVRKFTGCTFACLQEGA